MKLFRLRSGELVTFPEGDAMERVAHDVGWYQALLFGWYWTFGETWPVGCGHVKVFVPVGYMPFTFRP